jgi:hypothetical protein
MQGAVLETVSTMSEQFKFNTTRELWIGIDPGKKGFIVAYDGRELVYSYAIPYLGDEPDIPQIKEILTGLRDNATARAVFAVIEIQRVYGKQGAVSAGTTMGGYLALKASLVWLGIPFECVEAEDWKRAMGIPKPTGKMPKLPKKPPKGSAKKIVVLYKAEKAAIEKKRTAVRNELTKKRKALAFRKAQELAPSIDFRANERCKTPSDGKFEGFLIAVYAYRTQTRQFA